MPQIDWKGLLFGDQDWQFLPETAFRTIAMFLVILLSLRLLGKRGIKQLSVFELGVIIGLGSAAGDPMFYKEVGLLPAVVVFVTVMALYKLVTFLINRSDGFEKFVEGEPTYIIKEGHLLVDNFDHEDIAIEELFMQLRLNNVTHLGQIEQAILETNGEVSIFYLPEDKVQFGLPILPCSDNKILTTISKADQYSCAHCGITKKLATGTPPACECGHKKGWRKAINVLRIN